MSQRWPGAAFFTGQGPREAFGWAPLPPIKLTHRPGKRTRARPHDAGPRLLAALAVSSTPIDATRTSSQRFPGTSSLSLSFSFARSSRCPSCRVTCSHFYFLTSSLLGPLLTTGSHRVRSIQPRLSLTRRTCPLLVQPIHSLLPLDEESPCLAQVLRASYLSVYYYYLESAMALEKPGHTPKVMGISLRSLSLSTVR